MVEEEKKRRLFAGLLLDDAARAQCAIVANELCRTGFAAKYEAVEKLHVTLAFLGNVAASRYEEIAAALQRGAAPGGPFQVTLDKLGAFPHERKPHVVFIGAREQGEVFRTLAASLQSAYGALGFTFKEDPVAHVTIARVKESPRALPLVEFEPIALQVTALTLFESVFDPQRNTSRYAVCATAPLVAR